jgi:glutamyl-tRNA synthetase
MFHVGGARTTLFNWLFARQQGGTFVLRIEDTDTTRNHPEWTDMIYRSLEWLGLSWDAAYNQSDNVEAHVEVADKMFADGLAYYCDCTPEALQQRKKAAGEKTPGYDSHCSGRDLAPAPGRALRFRVPDEGVYVRNDVVRGTTEIQLANIEDFVILRGNRTPLYVLANAHDDVLDGITHVVRSEEHLGNVEKQHLLRSAMGHGDPTWVHVPMIVNEQRKKLSKRRDRVSLESFRDEGYLPEAMLNYLATLGWMPPNEYGEELAGIDAMVEAFSFDDVNSAPAQFDVKKLAAFNGFYIRRMSAPEFADRSITWLRETIVDRLAPLLQERAERLPDAIAMVDFLLHREPVVERASWDKAMLRDVEKSRAILDGVLAAFRDLAVWESAELKAVVDRVGQGAGLKLAAAQAPVRVAVTGRTIGPPLFESLELLGRERTIARIEAARRQLD